MASSESDLTHYLNAIGRHPVLTKEAQLRHCKRIHEWVNWPEGRAEAPAHIARKGQRSMDTMVRCNLRLVVSIARKYVNRGMDLSDLIQEGNIGMIRSLELYDPARGYAFTTYAYWWIRQSITRAIHMQARTIRMPVSAQELVSSVFRCSSDFAATHGHTPTTEEIALMLNIDVERIKDVVDAYTVTTCSSLDRIVTEDGARIIEVIPNQEDHASVSPECALRIAIQEELMAKALQDLPVEERVVVERQYIHNDTVKGLSKELGIPRGRLIVMRQRALTHLRDMLQDYEM